MKSLRQRLESVSVALNRVQRRACPECGWYEGKEMHATITFAEQMENLKDAEPVDRSADNCSKCGRPLVLRIEFDDRG